MQLRSYQSDGVLAVLDAWYRGVRRPVVVLPTGLGKTVMFAALCALLVRRGHKPLILTARDELVEQTLNKLRDADPWLSVGIIRGPDNQLHSDVTIASVQTLSRQKRLAQVPDGRWDTVIADECHWSVSDSWLRIMDHLGVRDPDATTNAVGFTATLSRTDKRGLGDLWDEVCFTRDLQWAIDEGYLVPVTAQTVMIPDLHLEDVKVRGGDLVDSELGKAMAQAKAGPLIAQAYSDLARNQYGELRRGICFTPSIELAESFLLDFRAAGIPTELVIGNTPRAERQAKYRATEDGSNKVLMSVGVLTTGFDCPPVEVCVMARPTKSPGLYVQCVGRSLRPSPGTGKESALILDVVGVTNLGLASIIDLNLSDPDKEKEPGLDEFREPGAARVPGILPDAPDQVGWRPVDPFHGLRRPDKPRFRRPRSAWQMTEAGIPYLPTTSTFSDLIFLWADGDSWVVGRKPSRGRAEKVHHAATFAEAVQVAQGLHPRGGRPGTPLVGPITDGQIGMLNRFNYPISEGMTKEQASQVINRCLASAALDPR